MTGSPTLIVFARQPHFGVGKTRLAARAGKWAAWQFQRRQILALSKLAQDPRWDVTFCWAHRQGIGDLGARLDRALNGPVGPKRLVIGSDIIALRPHHIAKAFQGLNSAPHVLGPSPDGGFWCIGSRGPVRLRHIRWSSQFALQDTIRRLGNVALVDALRDLD